jgi:hypothetical protein
VATLVAARYAENNGGVAVIGEHGYDDNNEWDFYNDALISEDASIYFYMWTPELVQAMRNEYGGEDHQEFKHRLYGIPFRPKIKYQYSSAFGSALTAINSKKINHPNPRSVISF